MKSNVRFPGQCGPFRLGSNLRGKNLLKREQILFQELTSDEMGGKNENKRVASPESVPTQLKNSSGKETRISTWPQLLQRVLERRVDSNAPDPAGKSLNTPYVSPKIDKMDLHGRAQLHYTY